MPSAVRCTGHGIARSPSADINRPMVCYLLSVVNKHCLKQHLSSQPQNIPRCRCTVRVPSPGPLPRLPQSKLTFIITSFFLSRAARRQKILSLLRMVLTLLFFIFQVLQLRVLQQQGEQTLEVGGPVRPQGLHRPGHQAPDVHRPPEHDQARSDCQEEAAFWHLRGIIRLDWIIWIQNPNSTPSQEGPPQRGLQPASGSQEAKGRET